MSRVINLEGDMLREDGEDPRIEERNLEEEQHAVALEAAQIEKETAEFTDELPFCHEVYQQSDLEDEDGGGNLRVQAWRQGDRNLYKGQTFFNKEQFAEAVLTHALKGCRNIRRKRYDKTNVAYRCIGSNCKWRVYCARINTSDVWEITIMNEDHSCVPNGDCHMLKVPVIARLFEDKLREEPEYYLPMKIAETIKENWGITASRPQCQASRNKALKWIEKEYDFQFQRLRSYGAEILHCNPQSTMQIETLKSAEGLDMFNRMYVCLYVLKTTWKECCRPIIGVDGCFLKSKMKGQLLVAIGRDANNAIYPIAWAVVQVEDTLNWMWFMNHLRADLGLGDGSNFVLLSDRQKGLINAVKEVLPNMEHRKCVRHIYNNFKTRHAKKPELRHLIWGLAYSYSEAAYKRNLNKILVYDKPLYDEVISSNPKTWCRAFYKHGTHCEDVHNNFTESWNATVVKVREKPLVPMLEIIARLSMVRIFNRYVQSVDCLTVCTPYAVKILEAELPNATKCRVHRGTNNVFQVISHGSSYQVCLDTRTCNCKKWDVRGIPCEHGYAVILSRKYDVGNFVSHWFRSDIWRKTYKEGIMPTRGSLFWPDDEGGDVYMPSFPPQPGRKKKQKRRKGVYESPKKKKQNTRTMHCSVCGAANHNSRFHKETNGQASGSQPSDAQVIVSQPSGPSGSQSVWIATGSQPSGSQPSIND